MSAFKRGKGYAAKLEELTRERDEAREKLEQILDSIYGHPEGGWRVRDILDLEADRTRLEAAEAQRDTLREGTSAFTFFPNGDPEQSHEAIHVERSYWQGIAGSFPHPNGEWAIRKWSRCLNRDDEWEYEPTPSSRDEEFFVRCRFELDDAISRARSLLTTPPGEEEA